MVAPSNYELMALRHVTLKDLGLFEMLYICIYKTNFPNHLPEDDHAIEAGPYGTVFHPFSLQHQEMIANSTNSFDLNLAAI